MTEPAGSAKKSTFTADSKEQVSISQAWVRTRTKSRTNVRPIS